MYSRIPIQDAAFIFNFLFIHRSWDTKVLMNMLLNMTLGSFRIAMYLKVKCDLLQVVFKMPVIFYQSVAEADYLKKSYPTNMTSP